MGCVVCTGLWVRSSWSIHCFAEVEMQGSCSSPQSVPHLQVGDHTSKRWHPGLQHEVGSSMWWAKIEKSHYRGSSHYSLLVQSWGRVWQDGRVNGLAIQQQQYMILQYLNCIQYMLSLKIWGSFFWDFHLGWLSKVGKNSGSWIYLLLKQGIKDPIESETERMPIPFCCVELYNIT